MADLDLRAYVEFIEGEERARLEAHAADGRGDEYEPTAYPGVTLLAGGAVVTGRPTTRWAFLRETRRFLLDSSLPGSADEETLQAVAAALSRRAEAGEPEAVYLMDASVVHPAGQFFHPVVAVRLDSVRAWTMGVAAPREREPEA